MKNRLKLLAIAASASLSILTRVALAEQAVALMTGNILWRFDTATPGAVTPLTITGLGAGEIMRGIDMRPATGTIVGSTVTDGAANNSAIKTYSIDLTTGAATLLGTIVAGLVPEAGDVATGYDFNPTADRIRYMNTNDENARINPNSGSLTANDTDINPAGSSTIIAAAYDRSFAGTTKTSLYVINRNTSEIAISGGVDSTPSPNGGVVTDRGSLGFVLNGGTDGGFDISPTGVGYAALSNIGTGVTGLYTINLTLAGAATTFIGALGNGTTEVYSLAILAPDADSDGVRDVADNCPTVSNGDQADLDADGLGNACDADADNDGITNPSEIIIGTDPVAGDSDGDGRVDGSDACPTLPAITANGCPSVSGAAPETSISKAPKNGRSRKARFEFTSTVPNATFECSIDNSGFKACKSPKTYNNLRVGAHSMKIRAVTATGIVDLTPSSAKWKVQ